jgi:hypothetical protein
VAFTVAPEGAGWLNTVPSVDAAVRFRYGGDLIAHGLRVDVLSPGMDEDDIAAFLVSLGLLMPGSVTLADVEVFCRTA